MAGFQRWRLAGLVAGGAIILWCGGCQQPQRRDMAPTRAIWVTRFDYKTPADVARVMDNCKQGGFNTVLFQVRGDGTVSYPSRIEPWAGHYDFNNPGFDPLAAAVTEAHKRGLQLHAWVNVMPAWRGDSPPRIRNQLYHTHPEWFWYDRAGHRQPLMHRAGGNERAWYVSLNPCLPEVRAYLVAVCREIVGKYAVDGLHLDYIRFPNEAVVPGEQVPDYPRDRKTLALFQRATGATPEGNPTLWNKWRCDQVTQLVMDLRRMVKSTRPQAVLSAAVGPDPRNALHHYQDSRRWIGEGLVDAVFIMNYSTDVEVFAQRNRAWTQMPRHRDVRIIPGVSISESGSVPARQSAEVAQRQIAASVGAFGHFSVFAYSLLYDSGNTTFSTQTGAESTKRGERRQVLTPYMRSLERREVRLAGAR
jgi:uncharacterized lipoprotein YddW (UPF0748 family)